MRVANEDELSSLLELPVIRACQRKWNLGRAEHGPVFVGDPLEELYGELADALNYADQLDMEGYNVATIRARLFRCATEVRDLWLEQQGIIGSDGLTFQQKAEKLRERKAGHA